MSDWQDFCDSQGIPNDENAIDHLLSLLDADENDHARHGEKSRPRGLLDKLEKVFHSAGMSKIKSCREYEWHIRLQFESNHLLDVWHNHGKKISAFHFLPRSRWSEDMKDKVRVALQVHLPQAIKPHEQGLWPKSRWSELWEEVNKTIPSPIEVEVDHAPKMTQLNAVGFLPDPDGVVLSIQKMHCQIRIKYEGRNRVVEHVDGDDALCNHLLYLLDQVGISVAEGKNS